MGTLRLGMVGGTVTGARLAGTEGPALLFVHGVGSTAAIWDPQLAEFGSAFRCAAIELRGNGTFEDPQPALISRGGFASDVLGVADALHAERFTIVGCSLGGVVAFELWKRAPERVDAMVVVGSFARYPDGEGYAATVKSALLEMGDMRAFAEARVGKLNLSPERTRETVEQMACKSVPCYLAATDATWTGDYRDVLPTIRVPVLVLCGERDAIAPPELSQAIAAAIPNARYAVVEGAGHVANADAPQRFNELLREFLPVGVP